MDKPTIGRTVLYTMSAQDAEAVNRRREDARAQMSAIRAQRLGYQAHVGNPVHAGDQCPMVIVKIWGDSQTAAVNGKVLLDGNDDFWATSVDVGEGPGTWAWPVRA